MGVSEQRALESLGSRLPTTGGPTARLVVMSLTPLKIDSGREGTNASCLRAWPEIRSLASSSLEMRPVWICVVKY